MLIHHRADDFARLDAPGRAQVCVGHGQGPSFGRVQTDHVALRQVMRAFKMVHPFGPFFGIKNVK